MATSIRLRPASLDDVPAMGGLARARELAYEGEEEITDAEIAHDLATPDFDLAHDAWVAEDADGRVVGYGDVLPGGDAAVNATIWTPPEDSAIAAEAEAALFDAVEARAAELARQAGRAATAVHVFAVPAEASRLAALDVRGYDHVRTFHRMVLPADRPIPDAPVPDGVEVRLLDRDRDAEAVHALLLRAFAEHDLLGVPEDLAAWRHETIDERRWVPGPSLVATADDAVVAAVVGFPEDERGWIRNLAVAASHRGSGLGAALLRLSFEAFRTAGLAEVGLGVDSANRSGATRLYERMGMVVARRVELHELRVPAAG